MINNVFPFAALSISLADRAAPIVKKPLLCPHLAPSFPSKVKGRAVPVRRV